MDRERHPGPGAGDHAGDHRRAARRRVPTGLALPQRPGAAVPRAIEQQHGATFTGDRVVVSGASQIGVFVGHGVFEVASDLAPEEQELDWMRQIGRETGRPVTFACLQNNEDPQQWRRLLTAVDEGSTISYSFPRFDKNALLDLQRKLAEIDSRESSHYFFTQSGAA